MESDCVKLDIVLPIHRPKKDWEKGIAGGISETVGLFEESCPEVTPTFHLVNDGADAALYGEKELDAIRNAAHGRFLFHTYTPNRGKGYALRYAVRRTTGDFLVYTDSDFPFGVRAVAECFNKLRGGANVVMGIRSMNYSSGLSGIRKFLSRNMKWTNRKLLGLPAFCRDTQAGIKAFDHVGKEAFLAARTEAFLFDTEFIVIANVRRLAVATVRVAPKAGLVMSKMGFFVMVREAKNLLLVVLRYRWRLLFRKKIEEYKQ